MSKELSSAVGKGGSNRYEDVVIVQELLNLVPAEKGGADQTLVTDGIVGPKTIAAIERFQRIALGFKWPDGRIDAAGKTMTMLLELVRDILATGDSGGSASDITVRQYNPREKTNAHPVTNPVISPLMTGDLYEEIDLPVEIHEFLFEVTKGSSAFWVGAAVAAVSSDTIDFTRAQVYFHPTVVQHAPPKPPIVHAEDEDYAQFQGGWPEKIQRYVAMQGGQLAGARLMPLLVPFTTMRALDKRAHNMFSDRPVETLNAVMAAIQRELMSGTGAIQVLAEVGVSSFSSGIRALKLFLRDMSSSGFVKEIIDFDSPWIVALPKALTRSPGAVSKCYTQVVRTNPPTGWVNMPAKRFAAINSYREVGVHNQIGWMAYYMAMLTSAIP